MTPSLQIADSLAAATDRAARRATRSLLERQHTEGFWWGDLTADSTLEADWFLLLLWLHPPQDGVWNPPNRAEVEKAIRSILARQLPDGGFNIHPRGPSEISASVKAYFALKLGGVPVDDARMASLRDRILALGGIQAANSYVKINLSLFGLFPKEYAPSVPPELTLFGNVLYEMSSWTRAIVVSLSLIHSGVPGRPVPAGFNVNELILPGVPLDFKRGTQLFSWRRFFLAVDRIFKWWEKHPIAGVRSRAIEKAKTWMLERLEHSDGLAAIYPPMMYTIMALDVLGYGPETPERVEAQRQFDALLVDDGERFFFQPCFSPVWDTAIAAFAIGEAGMAPPGAMRATGDWLLKKEVRRKGDWSVKRPNTEPSGWYFEFANEFYPDIDDTAMVLLGLEHAQATDRRAQEECTRRAVNWLLAMQGKDGGWAAFDVDNDWEFLSHVPFADHNAMLDPSCADITGRVVEALVRCGVDRQSAAIQKGVRYLLKSQEPDGSWYGRWGVNYVYGTFLALRGLRAAGYSDREAAVLRAGEWLRSNQNADGGWGESCASYPENAFVAAPSTPSQTAWAVLGLLAGGDAASESVRRGVEWLVENQREDGTWLEELATGTGFPRVFYLSYHLYRDMFPLLALGEFLKTRGDKA
ncbi:MAG: squalene--hopene cyclase [Bryobacterales bacterium]|nr:squalene--hopene cyclase [Bryobacterales bacterium]